MLENIRTNSENFNINNPLKPLDLSIVGRERDLPIEHIRLGLIKTSILKSTVSPEDGVHLHRHCQFMPSFQFAICMLNCPICTWRYENNGRLYIYGCTNCSHLWNFRPNYSLWFCSKDTLIVHILWSSCSDVFCTKHSRKENRIEIIKLYMNHTFIFLRWQCYTSYS